MPNCCKGGACACVVVGGTGAIVTGSGSPTNPFTIDLDFAMEGVSNAQFAISTTGTGTQADPLQFEVQYAPTAKLDNIPDVNAPAPTNGQVLTWQSSSSTWIAAPGTTAPTGAVSHDTSLSGDGSVGVPLQVLEDPARFLGTTGAGLGLNDAGIRNLVRHFADDDARDLAAPPMALNTLTMLDSAPGELEYWTGTQHRPVRAGLSVSSVGEFLQMSGAYAGGTVEMMIRQVSTVTDTEGNFTVLSAVDLSGRAGVLSAQFQEAGPLGFKAVLQGDVDAVLGTAYRLDTGEIYPGQAVLGTVVAWVY